LTPRGPIGRSPRKSAVAIPLVVEGGRARVLVGRRHPKSRFLGGFFAFPGGAIEPEDGDLDADGEDAVLRRTASRELEEETGLVIAPDALLNAGRRVTPPFGPKRFDSLMYVAPFDAAIEPSPAEPGELLDMHWEDPVVLVRRWRELEIRVAPPLIPMLPELAVGADDAGSLAKRLAALNTEMEADGPRIEFVPDVLTLLLPTPTLPPATHTNCYLVGSRELLVVDPGARDPEECDRVVRHVRRRAAEGGVPKAVVLTHHHGDHVGGAARVAEALGVGVWAHGETWNRWGDGVRLRGAAGSRDLVDGDRMELSGGERFRVMHTPGHAAGHVALLEETRGSLFAGDLVSGVSTVLVDSAPGSMDLYLQSLERIRDCGARTLFPGHGFPFIHPERGVQRVIEHRLEREARVLAALEDGPRELGEIARLAYGDTPGADPSLAAGQAERHLDRLERAGRVERRGGGWVRTP
jgi:glyoxylase-like metal-dependent hydrolase (beta-lactamase superfamily II)/8-oxo-dGTP pyrophosphatase MutT (NUDIX family)